MSKSLFGIGRILHLFKAKKRETTTTKDSTQNTASGVIHELEHKNLELLRFYVSRDIKKLDKKIQEGESKMLGYFLGSLVDALIVILFGDYFDKLASWISESIFGVSTEKCVIIVVLFKILCIILLIVLFCLIASTTRNEMERRKQRARESGKAEFVLDEAQQEIIDQFDNIACDGLLICESYIQKHKETDKKWVQDFYLYEIIHHLTKAATIFDSIYENQGMYVSSTNAELLDTYRVNNFIEFFYQIVIFIKNTIPGDSGNKDLDKDVVNLVEYTKKWKKL